MRRKESTSKVQENIAEAEAAKLLILATYGKCWFNPIDFCSTSFDTESCTLKRIKNRSDINWISSTFICQTSRPRIGILLYKTKSRSSELSNFLSSNEFCFFYDNKRQYGALGF